MLFTLACPPQCLILGVLFGANTCSPYLAKMCSGAYRYRNASLSLARAAGGAFYNKGPSTVTGISDAR